MHATVFIAAASFGSSSTTSVLTAVLGKPIIDYVYANATAISEDVTFIHDPAFAELSEHIRRSLGNPPALAANDKSKLYADLAERLERQGPEVPVLILAGNAPLLDVDELGSLIERQMRSTAAASTVSVTGAMDETLAAAVFRPDALALALRAQSDTPRESLSTVAASITNAAQALDERGMRISRYAPRRGGAALCCEGFEELAQITRELQLRINAEWMRKGVEMLDPTSIWIDATVELERGVRLEPSVILRGNTTVRSGSVIGPQTSLIDTTVEEGARVVRSEATSSIIGARSDVGPYAHLRPGTVLGREVRAGTFVELKQANVGDRTQIAHLAYVGGALVGKDVNIGAGTTFSLFDGMNKHTTTIGDGAFIGCLNSLVAPVAIGAGAFTAAGSTITDDIPAGALAIERGEQVNIRGWVRRKRPQGMGAIYVAEE